MSAAERFTGLPLQLATNSAPRAYSERCCVSDSAGLTLGFTLMLAETLLRLTLAVLTLLLDVLRYTKQRAKAESAQETHENYPEADHRTRRNY